ncbi:MAG: hypothetical protein JXQ27_18040 [Acidobacteria bacterium]|nr:hypothetical protein [Acidobacteriota bacterium]
MNTTYLLFFAVFLGFYAVLLLVLLFSSRLERRRRRHRRETPDQDHFEREMVRSKT